MNRTPMTPGPARRRPLPWAIRLTIAVSCVAVAAHAAATGKIQGRVVAADSGEPIGFADVALLPADTTMRPVGGLTNADGSFLLEAAPGRYALRIRALSYARKRVEGIVLEAGKLVPFDTALEPEAILQEEVVVEARARLNNEAALLAARKKAAAVGDAVSAEQMRKSPDKDAAEVLRRVTGLSISDDKYVFVRGLGERYSSTEVDGVRIASPEQNKRVVPLDLVPANLLENIVVQKTYTADRPGEFGGGDVQVHTRDFPGNRTWMLSVSEGYAEGVTFRRLQTYPATRADVFGFGADARRVPGAVTAAGGAKLADGAFPRSSLQLLAQSFRNVWSPTATRAIPNAGYSATYADELRLLGHPLGLIESWSLSRSHDRQDEAQRFFESDGTTRYDYAVQRSTESVQLGGMSGMSYRISPRHTLRARGLWTHSADDEVRRYEGPDHNLTDAETGQDVVHRDTRLMYVERSILSGALEGEHELSRLHRTAVSWKLTHSDARRLQPDRREVTYDHRYYRDADGNLVGYWGLGSRGQREFGDLHEKGWGATVSGALPYRLGRLGDGKLVAGYDDQTKHRRSAYRRFSIGSTDILGLEAPPESLFRDPSVYLDETTLDSDNYRAIQHVAAGFLSLEVPFGRRLRGTFGVRGERGSQDVRSFDLFDRTRTTARGGFASTDWLPSANLTWAASQAINLRIAGSRTLSRPDLNELSPSPTLEYVGGFRQAGNPDLRRALIDNYDVRLETFPGLSEVIAAGFFYKRLHQPIEQTITGGAPPILVPRNSDHGRNLGVELETRTGLGRVWKRLSPLSVNANASFISSQVRLKPQASTFGTEEHPLEGQATYVVNGALSCAVGRGRGDATLLLSAIGKRLRTIGYEPLPDIYDRPTQSLDATMSISLLGGSRVKLAGRNLLDPRVRRLQGTREISSYRAGRSYSIACSFGS